MYVFSPRVKPPPHNLTSAIDICQPCLRSPLGLQGDRPMLKKIACSLFIVLLGISLLRKPVFAQPTQAGYTRMILTFRKNATPEEKRKILSSIKCAIPVEDLPGFNIAIIEVPKARTLAIMEESKNSPSLRAAEKDFRINWIKDVDESPSLSASFEQAQGFAQNARFHWPWGQHQPSTPGIHWNLRRLKAPQAWVKTQGNGVRVAIIDTGVDCAHPDLNCNLSDGANMTNAATPPMDDNGHGTHVAGIIAGQGKDGGVFGVAPRVTLIPVKVLSADGSGNLSDVVSGIYWAMTHGAQVINMSLGAPTAATALEQAVHKAYQAGVVIVAAAGNDGENASRSGETSTVDYPGAYPWVIAVAASDRKDHIAPFSSFGPAVDITAPGDNILSTVPNGYEKMSGTSMASPHIAGVAALAIASGISGPESVKGALNSSSSLLCPKVIFRGPECAPATDEGNGIPDASKIVALR